MSEQINFSLNSKEDIYDFLDRVSFIYEGKDSNNEMFSIYHEFVDIAKKVPNNKYIVTYYHMKLGKVKFKEGAGSSIEQCAQKVGTTPEHFTEGLDENVESLKRLKKEKWLEYINHKYKNVYFHDLIKYKEKEPEEVEQPVNVNTHVKKKTFKKRELTDEQKAQKEKDLEDLFDLEKDLNRRIKKMRKGKVKSKDKEDELEKLIGTRIQVLKDINIIRKSYGEVLGKQNNIGRRSFTSYEGGTSSYDEAIYAHEEQQKIIKESQQEEVNKIEKVKFIKKVAKNVLTNRQYLIFEFYYFNDLTQQEIADVMDTKQPNINRDIKTLNEKIIGEL